MTAIHDYRKTLKDLVEKHNVKYVLEIGIEKGVSTKVFCESGCHVIGVDIEQTQFKHDNFHFYKGDSTEYLKGNDGVYDLIFLDAFYTYERLERDVPLCWEALKDGGILVFNEYIDFAAHRNGEVSLFVQNWANEYMRSYKVYPLRNGFAVFEK